MTIPTRNCNACAHQAWTRELGRMTCRKGHKPRFYYYPAGYMYPSNHSWGYKRKCADFEPKPTKETTP
jgi:hypothetical protein